MTDNPIALILAHWDHQPRNPGATHWDECWKSHPRCALDLIALNYPDTQDD